MRLLNSIFLCLFFSHVFGQQLVLPGDHPDPSVVKIGDTYWATSTSSNWFPAYPILRSNDLIKWTTVGHVFNDLPEWADYYFWAPEISYEKGKVYVYYAAHKKNGNLCVAVASADKPEGPYKDHGPLICQEAGSIDAFAMRDIDGKLYLIWKEDGNSIGKPTPIWAIQLNESRTATIGEKKELFRNDSKWEGNLVEGVSMVRHGDYFYALYAGAGCCGRGCTYAIGVARSKSLLGPWEKYSKNPIMANTDEWICPGHGTATEKNGKNYFLYHAYNKISNVFTGRQGLISEYTITPDNWIEFVATTDNRTSQPIIAIDNFRSRLLSESWEYSVFEKADARGSHHKLWLGALQKPSGSFIGQKIISGNYNASIDIYKKNSTAMAGLAVIGDEKNIITAFFLNNKIMITQIKDGQESVLLEKQVSVKKKLHLNVEVKNGKDITFSYLIRKYNGGILNEIPIDGSFLPPWDRAIRVGLVSKGDAGKTAVFKRFLVVYR